MSSDQAEDQIYFYSTNGHAHGPVSSGTLKRLAAEGIILSSDFIWKKGAKKKYSAGAVKGLFPVATREFTESSNADTHREPQKNNAPFTTPHAKSGQSFLDCP